MSVESVHVKHFRLSVRQYSEYIRVDDLDQYVQSTRYIYFIKNNRGQNQIRLHLQNGENVFSCDHTFHVALLPFLSPETFR